MRTDGGPGFHQVIFADHQTPAQCGEHALGLGPGIAMTHDDAPTRACRQLADHAAGEGFRRTFAREQQARDLHVTFGIVWLVTLLFQVGKLGLTAANQRRLMCLSMFWHFLDVVWIAVFTFVYLMGVL